MAGAFTGGQGDYVTLFEPAATQVVTSGEGYILCSIGAESGQIPYTAYFASQSYIQAHDDVIAAFCRAIARALDWVDSHTDQMCIRDRWRSIWAIPSWTRRCGCGSSLTALWIRMPAMRRCGRRCV